jgi:Large ribosomal RNA subunit accumulation protein YceD
MEKTANFWIAPVDVEDIPETGLHVEIDAPAEVRAAVAELASLRSLPQFTAAFDLTRQGAGVHVSGRVNARIGQTCVVTLEPIESDVFEPIDLQFAPGNGDAAPASSRKRELAADDEAPEPIIEGKIDLGALATEFLILGVDPYPRKAGVEFAPPQLDDPAEHPFAALAALKNRMGGGQS